LKKGSRRKDSTCFGKKRHRVREKRSPFVKRSGEGENDTDGNRPVFSPAGQAKLKKERERAGRHWIGKAGLFLARKRKGNG